MLSGGYIYNLMTFFEKRRHFEVMAISSEEVLLSKSSTEFNFNFISRYGVSFRQNNIELLS